MSRSEKNIAICNFWLKFTSFVAKRKVKCKSEVYKKGRTPIKINEANRPFGELWKNPEEIFWNQHLSVGSMERWERGDCPGVWRFANSPCAFF